LFISALYSWWRWEFSLGRFFAHSIAGGIRIIIVRSRRQNTSSNPSIACAIQHWRKPAACLRFAPENSLHPRPDLERMIDRTTNPSRLAVGKRTNGGCEKNMQ
jgi:hypothetical protein